jgi:hypothetical protein
VGRRGHAQARRAGDRAKQAGVISVMAATPSRPSAVRTRSRSKSWSSATKSRTSSSSSSPPTRTAGWSRPRPAWKSGSHVWPGMTKGECAGTTDACAYSWDELLVLDAKFGFVQVDPRGNPQLMLYALGLWRKFPTPSSTSRCASPSPTTMAGGVPRASDDAWRSCTSGRSRPARGRGNQGGLAPAPGRRPRLPLLPGAHPVPRAAEGPRRRLHEAWLEERSLEELLPSCRA